MATVQEVFRLTTDLDLKWLGHRVFWALKEGKVQAEDNVERLNEIDYDDVAIEALIAQNKLEIGKIKLYVAETATPELFAFYFAENVLEVSMLHQALFREKPIRIVDGEDLTGKAFEFQDEREAEILFMYRSKISAFPCYLGHAWAGERVFYRMDH